MKLVKLDGLGQLKSPLPSREFKASNEVRRAALQHN
jgi:hypothetical protein